MHNNYMPYIVLGCVVAISLVWKGYLKLPAQFQRSPIQAPTQVAIPANTNAAWLPPVECMDSATLGAYFVAATRREAELSFAAEIAAKAGTEMRAMFTAPFSPPAAPAGPLPPKPAAATP